jgi:hypothetical protein
MTPCTVNLGYECSRRWRELEKTDDPRTRFCTACSTDVFKVETEEELAAHKAQGHCVAVFFKGYQGPELLGDTIERFPTGS